MDSTVYRRGADGKIVGTPESQRESDPVAREPHQQQCRSSEMSSQSFSESDHPNTPPAARAPDVVPSPGPQAQQKFEKSVKQKSTTFTRAPVARYLRAGFRLSKLVVIGYLIFYIAFGLWTSMSLSKTDAFSSSQVSDTAGTNWLLVGSDSRKGLTLKEQHQLHTGPDSGTQRTDVIMIVHIGGTNSPTIISLPRDSFVVIPAHVSSDGTKVPDRKNKINAAYSFGGAPLLVATVEANTGLHIDHYMEIGFAGIRDLTNSVGGVRICVPKNYDDKNSNLHVKKGCQVMNGKTSLAYVRMRYADPTGDIGRIQRQQQYLAALIHKVLTPGMYLNPLSMIKFSRAGTNSVEVGKGDGTLDVARLGMAMRNLTKGQGKVMTVPISNPDATTSAGSSVLWDHAKAKALFQQLGAN